MPAALNSRSNSVFPRKKRLSRAQFPTALMGRRVSSVHFSVVIPKNIEGYAVIVPKKIAKLSVTRHIIKRRVLSALRKLSLPPSLIVFSRSSLDGVHYQDIEKELADLISKIN